MDIIVNAQNLFKSFNGKNVPQNCNLSLLKGEIYSILGVNGAGKTTLMKLLLGLQKPDSGTISLFGENAAESKLSLSAVMAADCVVSEISGVKLIEPDVPLLISVPCIGILSALFSSATGIISVTIGWKKRSVPTAIVSSFIVGCLLAQCFSISYKNILTVTAVVCTVMVVASCFVYGILAKSIDRMEV